MNSATTMVSPSSLPPRGTGFKVGYLKGKSQNTNKRKGKQGISPKLTQTGGTQWDR